MTARYTKPLPVVSEFHKGGGLSPGYSTSDSTVTCLGKQQMMAQVPGPCILVRDLEETLGVNFGQAQLQQPFAAIWGVNHHLPPYLFPFSL